VGQRTVERLVDGEQEVVPDELEQAAHRRIGAQDGKPAAPATQLLDGVEEDPNARGVDEGGFGEVDQQPGVAVAYQVIEPPPKLRRRGDIDLPG
jgi:hypothetical protein